MQTLTFSGLGLADRARVGVETGVVYHGVMKRGCWFVFGIGLLALALTGCGGPAEVKKVEEAEVVASLPPVYGGITEPDWSARKVVAVPLPNQEEWVDLYANPFFDPADWAGEKNEARRTAALTLLRDWGNKVGESTESVDYLADDVSAEFQKAVSAKLVEAHLMVAEGSARSAAESVREALRMGNESLKTGPGLEGLNQTVPVLMSAQMAAQLALEPGMTSEDRRQLLYSPMGEIDFRVVIPQKLREHLVLDVLPRMTNVGRSDNVAEMGAALLGAEGVEDEYLELTKGAFRKDGDVFDAKAATALAVKWTDEIISAMELGWDEVEKVLAAREKVLTDTWGLNPFQMQGVDPASLAPPKGAGEKMMTVLFAYDATQAAVPILESAMVAQISLDAAKLSVLMADAAGSGKVVRSRGDLPDWGSDLVDPLTLGDYEIDFGSRTLKTSLKSVPETRFLLAGVVDVGVRF